VWPSPMRESGSYDAAGAAPDSQRGSGRAGSKRVAGSRLPPISSVPPTPQTMLQDHHMDRITSLPTFSAAPAFNPASNSVRGVEDWGTRSSRALSTGAGVVRRRMTAGSGLEPLPLGRRPGANSSSSLGLASGAGSVSTGGLPSAAPAFKRAPLFPDKFLLQPRAAPSQPKSEAPSVRSSSVGGLSFGAAVPRLQGAASGASAQLRDPGWHSRDLPHRAVGSPKTQSSSDSVQATNPQRPPSGEGQFVSRPHGIHLRRATDGEAVSATPTSAQRGEVEGATSKAEPKQSLVVASKAEPKESLAAPSKAEPKETPVAGDPAKSVHAAKCAAIADLQRLFFEEVGRGGDANAAAAKALLRLAEESRPAAELSPRRSAAVAAKRDHSRTASFPTEGDLIVREAEECQSGDRLLDQSIASM